MKCRKHPYELGVGVCASCLRERLLAVIAAQNAAPSPDSLDPPPPPPPQISASPLRHRRSLNSRPSPSSSSFFRRPRFFSTPQVGPTSRTDDVTGTPPAAAKNNTKLSSLLFALFTRSKPSKSWISNVVFSDRRTRKKNLELQQSRLSKTYRERGMSPEIEEDESACSSGYSSESSTGWRRPKSTPVRKLAERHRHSRGVSGFGVCLSPLLRPSPKLAQPDLGGGEHRNLRRHVSAEAASLEPSRSRKLADFGRFR